MTDIDFVSLGLRVQLAHTVIIYFINAVNREAFCEACRVSTSRQVWFFISLSVHVLLFVFTQN